MNIYLMFVMWNGHVVWHKISTHTHTRSLLDNIILDFPSGQDPLPVIYSKNPFYHRSFGASMAFIAETIFFVYTRHRKQYQFVYIMHEH